MAVSAGLVVALVAVRCVDRKSVSRRNGSNRILHLLVNSFRLSTISSRLFAFRIASDCVLECPFALFSPDVAVDDRVEKRREYMPSINSITTTIGPPHRRTGSPYNVIAQKPASRRKLSHGSPLVHDNSPAILLSGCMKGYEYANVRVTCGGVATSRGDFWWTSMVERCRNEVGSLRANVGGEKAATVGGFGSLLLLPPAGEEASSRNVFCGVDMCWYSSHGRLRSTRWLVRGFCVG
jgi:hypothetical protein